MSAQNNLKKPTFSKGVMGYTPAEVDRYIDHVNERYNTVSREAAELKRKVINLQLRLDEAEGRLAEAEKQSVTDKIFDKSSVSQLFDMLERENSRHAQFIDLLKDKLCDMMADEPEESDDDDWQDALGTFIDAPDWSAERAEEPAFAEEAAPAAEPAEPEAVPYVAVFGSYDTVDAAPAAPAEASVEAPATEPAEAPATESAPDDDGEPELLSYFTEPREAQDDAPAWSGIDEIFSLSDEDFAEAAEPVLDDDDVIFPAEAADEEPAPADEPAAPEADTSPDAESVSEEEKSSKTPAESLAELDFYQDDVHQDGESFDPMTLAAQSASKKRKLSYEDFFSTLPPRSDKG